MHPVLFLVILKLSQLKASFIDVKNPIIISDQTAGSTHFSYEISGVSTNGVTKIYLATPSAKISGSPWACDVHLKENGNSIQCARITGHNSIGEPSCVGYDPSPQCLSQEYQSSWLGGSLTAFNGSRESSFVYCGPSWRLGYANMEGCDSRLSGICYHERNGVTNGIYPPLRNKDLFLKINNEFTYFWFYAQFGFSIALDNSKTYLLVGAPGYYEWRGNAILINLRDVTPLYGQCPRQETFDNLFDPNSKVSFPFYNAMDYVGYHVSSGKENNKGTIFGVGAPRGADANQNKHLTGYTIILSMLPSDIFGQKSMSIRYTLQGDQFGGYFGSIVAFADVNGDGEDELLVGAPFQSLKQNNEIHDEGCVFVYLKRVLDDRLCPSTESGSRFGSAISNLGDINQDGYQDIGIGAPGGHNGQGIIFIYYGHSGKLSLKKDNPEIITAQDINYNFQTGIRGFGSSIYGNLDLDGNDTPDILIGAWPSNKLVIYRTRSHLEFKPTVTYHSASNSQQIYKLGRDEVKFVAKFCLVCIRTPRGVGSFEVHIESELSYFEDRFKFDNMNRNISFTLEAKDNSRVCKDVGVQRTKELESQNPAAIRFTWRMLYNNTKTEDWDVRQLILSLGGNQQLSKGNGQPWCTWCPVSTEASHDHSLPVATDNCEDDGNPECATALRINAKILGVPGSNKALDEYVVGSGDFQLIEASLENEGETAYAPTVLFQTTFSDPEFKRFLRIELVDASNRWISESGTFVLRDYPLHKGKRENFRVKISFDKNMIAMKDEGKVRFTLKAYPQPNPEQSKNSNSVEIKLVSDVNIVLAKIDNERSNEIEGSSTVFKSYYTITNTGKSPINTIRMTFDVPSTYFPNGNEEEEAVLIFKPRPSDRISCVSPSPKGFPDITTIPSSTQGVLPNNGFSNGTGPGLSVSRKKRSTEEVTTEKDKSLTAKLSKVKRFNIDCSSPQWKCVQVACKLVESSPLTSEILSVELNLAFTDNFTELYLPNDATVYYTTTASLWTFDDRDTKTASAISILQAKHDQSLPAYIFLLAGVGGLIIFLLLAFCLFKCGFFRRKTKEDLENLKAQAKKDEAENFPPQMDPHQ